MMMGRRKAKKTKDPKMESMDMMARMVRRGAIHCAFAACAGNRVAHIGAIARRCAGVCSLSMHPMAGVVAHTWVD